MSAWWWACEKCGYLYGEDAESMSGFAQSLYPAHLHDGVQALPVRIPPAIAAALRERDDAERLREQVTILLGNRDDLMAERDAALRERERMRKALEALTPWGYEEVSDATGMNRRRVAMVLLEDVRAALAPAAPKADKCACGKGAVAAMTFHDGCSEPRCDEHRNVFMRFQPAAPKADKKGGDASCPSAQSAVSGFRPQQPQAIPAEACSSTEGPTPSAPAPVPGGEKCADCGCEKKDHECYYGSGVCDVCPCQKFQPEQRGGRSAGATSDGGERCGECGTLRKHHDRYGCLKFQPAAPKEKPLKHEDSANCWCSPRVEDYGGRKIVIHNEEQ